MFQIEYNFVDYAVNIEGLAMVQNNIKSVGFGLML